MSLAAQRAPGSDTPARGLDPLDRDRAASLADEGGAAGARVEAQEPRKDARRTPGPDDKAGGDRKDEPVE